MTVNVASVRVLGPLGPYVEGFRDELDRLGYTPLSAIVHVRLTARLESVAGRAGAGGGFVDGDAGTGGVIVVRGKGNRSDALPLPADVGQAIVGYLPEGRPRRALDRPGVTGAPQVMHGIGTNSSSGSSFAS